MHNPLYCGLIRLALKEDAHFVKALHEPLISEKLSNEVQSIITTKRKVVSKTDQEAFPLAGGLICPICSRKLCGSFSRGSTKRYAYHCSGSCKIRFRAYLVNRNYNEKLQGLKLSDGAVELLALVLEDLNKRKKGAFQRLSQLNR